MVFTAWVKGRENAKSRDLAPVLFKSPLFFLSIYFNPIPCIFPLPFISPPKLNSSVFCSSSGTFKSSLSILPPPLLHFFSPTVGSLTVSSSPHPLPPTLSFRSPPLPLLWILNLAQTHPLIFFKKRTIKQKKNTKKTRLI